MSSVDEQRAVLDEALDVYTDRQTVRGDLWKRYGWRGALHEMRVAGERAWRRWFNAIPVEATDVSNQLNVDELLDTINYAAMAVRAIREGNRDGDGWWDT